MDKAKKVIHTFEGLAFDKIKSEIISCINSFRKLNGVDLVAMSFIRDPVVAFSWCPVLFYDINVMLPYYNMFCPPTEDSEDVNGYDPITISAPTITMPNKIFMRDNLYTGGMIEHTIPLFMSPSILKKWFANDRITKMVITDRSVKFLTPGGFEVNENPIFPPTGHEVCFPFIVYALYGFGWRPRSIELVKKIMRVEYSDVFDKTSCNDLFNNLNNEVILPSGIKIYPDFIKQKPTSMRTYAYEVKEEKIMVVCLEVYFKEILQYVFYTYNTI